MARRDDLVDFAREQNLKILTVADIIEYRLRNETLVQRVAEARLPTEFGDFRAFVYRDQVDMTEHLVLVMGEVNPAEPIMVRAHREYLPGDVFGYLGRNTRNLLTSSMAHIAAAGNGVILYLKRNFNAIASELNGGLQDMRRVTSHTNALGGDFREYGIGAQILRDVGVRKIIVVSDRVPRLANLPGYGLEIVDSVPLSVDEPPMLALRANGHQ
jgi:3,4-dihydroxy 2-butanone 4-phosphate synthase/GTP cyclohydrolase II